MALSTAHVRKLLTITCCLIVRMLVYDYVNNGNLEQWLHGDVGPCSPLTWEIRMNIILGTAKGFDSDQMKLTF